MRDSPKISVIVAVYNEERYISEALGSILAQQAINLEVVFVDDKSTDSTLSIAQRIAEQDQRLRIYQSTTKGKCGAFNLGAELATGDYVCIFAGDDIMPAGSLCARLEAIMSLGMDIPVMGLSKLITISANKRFDGVVIPKAAGVGALSGVSPLMNRKALSIVFPVPMNLPNEDTWMELAALHLKQIKLVHSNIICCQWRMHDGNSINVMEPFEVYNRKYTERRRALPLFLDKFGELLDQNEKRLIESKLRCEQMRSQGNWLGVLTSRASLKDRLRALSTTNRLMFAIRRSLYALLSGR